MLLKRFIPKSLFNRFLLIILIPSAIVQITIIYIFYYNHTNNINKHMSGSMSSQIYLIYQMHKSDKEVKLTEDFSRKTGIIPTIVKNKKIHSRYRNYKSKKFLGFINLFPIIDSFTYLRSGLQASNIDLFIIYSSKNKNRVITEIQMENDILKLDLPKKRIVTTRRGVVIAWIVIMSSITAMISLLFIKNQIKSIKYLKKNAEKLGMGANVVNFKITGASEIR